MNARLKSRLEELRAELNALDRKRERVLGQIEAFEEMLMAGATESVSKSEPVAVTNLSGWRALLINLSAKDSFNYDDIDRESKRVGLSVTMPTIRSRMFKFVERGYAERLENGVFRFTEEGKKAAIKQ